MNPKALQRMTRARTALVLDHPFFGALALRLRMREDESAPTAYTDGQTLGYNPAFIEKLTDAQVKGLVAHEVLHCANGHCWRRGDRDPRQWNIACDAAINHHVLAAGLELPPDGIPGEDRAAEQIYGARSTTPPPGGYGAGGFGEVRDGEEGEGDGAEGAGNTADGWKIATIQAAQAAKAYGKLPACAARLLDEITNPPVDWRKLLADFVNRSARNDYDWTRANTRHLQRGFVLPTLRSNELPDIVIVADTSGSITPATLAMFAGAVSDVLSAYPTTAHVLAVDAQVHSSTTYRSEDLPIEIPDFRGGGGTDFRPAFDHVEREELAPACLIYLTDLCGTFPDEPPAYPVIWCATEPGEAPWGETVHVTE